MSKGINEEKILKEFSKGTIGQQVELFNKIKEYLNQTLQERDLELKSLLAFLNGNK